MLEKVKNACTFNPHVKNDKKHKIADIVGQRCLINGSISGIETECLWDTGSQVALISKSWIQENLKQQADIKSLSDLLEIEAVGGSSIP